MQHEVTLLGIAAVSLIAVLALPAAAVPPDREPRTPTAAPADSGRAIYMGKGTCFACHGPEGKGTPLAPYLTDTEWLHFAARPDAEQLRALIRKGVPEPVKHPTPMPPMGGAPLSEREVAAVADYVLTLSPPPPAD